MTLSETAGDGRIISGRDAYLCKLVDAMGTVAEPIAAARELATTPKVSVIRYVKPKPTFHISDFLSASSSRQTSVTVELNLLPSPK